MAKKESRVGIGTVTKELRDKFEAFCHSAGYVKGRAIEGAVTMFMGLPIPQQIQLMRKADGEEEAVSIES